MKETGANYPLPLPSGTRAIVDIRKLGKKSPNWGLYVQRFIRWEWERKRNARSEAKKNSQKTSAHQKHDEEEQSFRLEESSRKYQSLVGKKPSDLLLNLTNAYCERLKAQVDPCGGEVRTYRLISPLVIGLGGADVREVGFTFHRHGFPYLPASSLKGLARAAAELLCSATSEEMEEVFGHAGNEEAHRGQAIFWDAFPLLTPETILWEADILNPHFPSYYQSEGKEPPGEWDSPVPIFFLRVPAGVEFIFGIAGKEAKRAWDWLDKGLTELGSGAKTTLGYGRWERVFSTGGGASVPSAASVAAPSNPHEQASAPTPDTPKHKGPLRKGSTLPARIIRPNTGKQGLFVELHAEGYEGKEILCDGIASSFSHEGFIEVEVLQLQPVPKVKFKKRL